MRMWAVATTVATSPETAHAALKVEAHGLPQQVPTTMTSLQLPVFDDTRDKWKAYLIRAEACFEANAITDSKRRRALLVAALSTQTVQVLAGLIAPRMPNSLTYAEAAAALNDYYDPKRHEIAESYKFFTRCQQEGESVHAFLAEIRRIADNCNFGSALDRMLRDRIVWRRTLN